MLPADRLKKWVDDFAVGVKDRLGGWIASTLLSGVGKVFEFFEPEWIDDIKSSLEKMRDNPEAPTELKSVLDRMLTPGSKAPIPAVIMIIIAIFGGMAISEFAPSFKKMGYMVSRVANDYRLTPIDIITAWRRFPEIYEAFWEDLRDQGWSEERIEAFKKLTLFYPAPEDLVHWQAREVFEPSMIEKYGLDAEAEEIDPELFAKAGVSKEQMLNFWKAHWVHPDWRQVATMYHRGLITFEDIERWYRVVEIPPYWREKLTGITWDLPNRIETRMMARYGLVDKSWLVEHLGRIGLHEDYRSIAADFMLAMGIRLDISSRYSKGWLTSEDVKSEIATFGMSEDINSRLYQWIVKNVEPDRVEEGRDLTKTEIYAGVKKEVISWSEGLELLQDMGYDPDEAEYILKVRVGVAAGSPETYLEFKEWTQGYRKAMGLKAEIPPQELIEAGKASKEAKTELTKAEEKGLGIAKLAPYLKAKGDAEYRYRQLLIAWEEEKKKS